MKLKGLLTPIAFCLALTGCMTVGPDYEVPDQAVIQRDGTADTFLSAHEKVYNDAETPMKWWHMYDNETLNELIDKALEANTDLRIASANLARSRAILEETETGREPIFDVNASPTYGRNATKHGAIKDTDHWSHSTGAAMSYQVDLFGKIARAIEAADADVEATRAAYDMTRITVIADTTRAYLNVCSTGHKIDVAKHSVSLQEKSLETTGRLETFGRATALDVARSTAQLEQLRAAVPPLLAQQKIALFQLAILTGELPTTLDEKIASCRRTPQITQPIPVGDGALLLKRRPDIRQAERELAAATARIGVATADLYPSIRIGLSGGFTGTLTNAGSGNFFHWALGPLISWTIPATGPARARIKQAEAQTEAALASFDGTVLRALKETESALTTYARELDRNELLKRARDQSAKAADQAHRLYEYGRTDFLTTLDADRTLAEYESRLADSDAQLASDQVALFLALGGGWDKEATEAKKSVKNEDVVDESIAEQ